MAPPAPSTRRRRAAHCSRPAAPAGPTPERSRPRRGASSPSPLPRCGSSARSSPREMPSARVRPRPHPPAARGRSPGRTRPAVGAPRRPSCAESATQSPGAGCLGVSWIAGGKESTGCPRKAPATGEASAALKYQSPGSAVESDPAGQVQTPRAVVPSAKDADGPISMRRSARRAAWRTVAVGTMERSAIDRHRPGSTRANPRTGSCATSRSVR